MLTTTPHTKMSTANLSAIEHDLPLKLHPVAFRASAGDTPDGVTGARGQRAEPVRCAA